MSKKIGWLIALCAVVAGLLAYISYYSPTYTFRYQLTVDVDTPDGVKSGSSVVEANYERSLITDWFFGPGFGSWIIGEGVLVELGNGLNVVLTLTSFQSTSPRSTTPDALPVRIYQLPWWGHPDAYDEMNVAIARAKEGAPKIVPSDMLPLMVTFRDLQDPKTLERVDPQNLEVTFGPGYALKMVTMRATDAPVTNKLEGVMVWLQGLRSRGLDGGTITNRINPLLIADFDLRVRKE